MRKQVLILAASLTVLAVAAPAVSAPKTVTLTSKLKGVNEVPGPGDDDGRGKAVVRLNRAKQTVCYVLTMKRIEDAEAAHIHTGAAGESGGVLVPLFTTSTDKHRVKSCTTGVDQGAIDAILANPKGHYVNVHTESFDAGAIRGQLRKGKR